MRKSVIAVLTITLCYFSAQATLIDRGNGLIYDDVLDLTWLSNANYAQTSGYDDDGIMTWEEAMIWAASLEYAGYDDWRLPSAYNSDGSGPEFYYNTNDSEMGHLFYEDLEGEAYTSIYDQSNENLSLFSNILVYDDVNINDVYWTSDVGTISGRYWYFSFTNGSQWQRNPAYHGRGLAWAVRDGDVSSVPEPGILMMLCCGVFGLFFTKTKRGKMGSNHL